jgi:hypothetical protein
MLSTLVPPSERAAVFRVMSRVSEIEELEEAEKADMDVEDDE